MTKPKPDPLAAVPMRGQVEEKLKEMGYDASDVSQAAVMAGSGDAPLPVLENDPPYLFVPGSGISSLDLTEIGLMFVLQLVGGSITEQGALRRLAMQPQFREKLSVEAQRFMVQQKVNNSNG